MTRQTIPIPKQEISRTKFQSKNAAIKNTEKVLLYQKGQKNVYSFCLAMSQVLNRNKINEKKFPILSKLLILC